MNFTDLSNNIFIFDLCVWNMLDECYTKGCAHWLGCYMERVGIDMLYNFIS